MTTAIKIADLTATQLDRGLYRLPLSVALAELPDSLICLVDEDTVAALEDYVEVAANAGYPGVTDVMVAVDEDGEIVDAAR